MPPMVSWAQSASAPLLASLPQPGETHAVNPSGVDGGGS